MSGITITGFIIGVECMFGRTVNLKKFAGKCLSPLPPNCE
jgi:hypothetical protein